MLANWTGPGSGEVEVLPLFESVPNFQQMLLRASLRMLMVVSEFSGVQDWERAPEKRAAEIVLAYTSQLARLWCLTHVWRGFSVV